LMSCKHSILSAAAATAVTAAGRLHASGQLPFRSHAASAAAAVALHLSLGHVLGSLMPPPQHSSPHAVLEPLQGSCGTSLRRTLAAATCT
jgi:hypothetical protein